LAHIVIEYSSNLRGELDIQQLVNAVHESALATGVFPAGGLRTRAYEAQCYRIADGHSDNSFVHFELRVGHGRDLATRRAACERIFATVCEQLKALHERRPLGISLEMQELHAELNYKKNNLHEYVKSRQDLQRRPAE
jgi:5-carboxymethyl-2-hydroxymuconate isomerase